MNLHPRPVGPCHPPIVTAQFRAVPDLALDGYYIETPTGEPAGATWQQSSWGGPGRLPFVGTHGTAERTLTEAALAIIAGR